MWLHLYLQGMPSFNRVEDSTFTTAELERLLDWFRGLRLCHGDVPRDYELADKIAFELAKLRHPVEP